MARVVEFGVRGLGGVWRLVLLVALVLGLVAVPAGRGEAVQRPDTLYDERPVGLGPVETGFPIDHVGVVFDLPAHADASHDHDGAAHADVGIEVRFRHGGRWGSWQPMGEDGAQQTGQWTGALLPGSDAEAYQVRGVPTFARNARAGALNTTDGPVRTVSYQPAGAAHAITPCKSRADWGADESLRTSTRSYAQIQLMTVHHTATQNDDPDPDARVRAIYEYHTRTNGWDDIGYQALIAEDGTVYEGRWSGSDSPSCLSAGGTGWEFGHYGTAASAEMVTGAHTGGYNTGNFAVSLLGTLTDVLPKAAARDALVNYLAELADRHGLDPQAQVAYDNGTNSGSFDAISGHRDFKATECPGGLMYDDLPELRADVAAAMTAADSAPVVTITSPADADTYTVTEPTAGAGATVSFAASATDDTTASTDLGWTWTDGNGTVVATTASFDATLPGGTYTYTATATDSGGAAGSDAITVTVTSTDSTSTFVDDVASGEQLVTGTLSGSYLDTQADGSGAEAITEVESGGRPADRSSLLEHVWSVPVTGGTDVTLFVDAATTSSGDGDSFAFDYSIDAGATYSSPVLAVPAGTGGVYSASLPGSLSGPVQIRVTDTDRTPGARGLDTLTVDHLYVRSESGTSTTPATPTGFTATATSATTGDLSWTDVADEHGYELERSSDGGTTWTRAADLGADAVSHTDTGLSSSTSYGYRLRAYNSAGPSAWTETVMTTPTASTITLTASGRKVQGSHVVDLSWTGATDVVVHRDQLPVATVSGSNYSDATGGKGTGSYTHWVCTAADQTVCSNKVTTTFS